MFNRVTSPHPIRFRRWNFHLDSIDRSMTSFSWIEEGERRVKLQQGRDRTICVCYYIQLKRWMTCDYNHTHQPGPECHRGRREIVLCVLIIRAGNLTFKNETMMTINNIPPYYYSYIIYPKDYHQKSFFLVCYTTGKSLSAIFTADGGILVQLFFVQKKSRSVMFFCSGGECVPIYSSPSSNNNWS